jgi:hypothetical protein
MVPFIGFAPDVDPVTPGALTDCNNLIPTLRGMAGAPTPLDVGIDALPARSIGGAVLNRLDQLRRVFVGTRTQLFELIGTSYVNRSRSGGYTGSTENRWRFAQFGNASLACNETEPIQISTASGVSFSDIPTAPKARIIETASGFVLAFGLNSSLVGGDFADSWACSGIYDYATWTPGPGTQAANGRLLETAGDIRSARRLGKDVAVYKERSVYLGRYVGPPVVWAFDLISSNVGALCHEAVIDTGTAHVFIGRDDFWIFDGSKPRPIGALVKEWFFAHSDSTYRYKIRSYFDQFKNLCWWFYPTPGSNGELTDALVYNLNNDRWGKVSMPVQTVMLYMGSETTFDNWPPGPVTTFATMPDVPLDSMAFDTDGGVMGVIGSDLKLKMVGGACATASLTTGDIGDDVQYSTLSTVYPHFTTRPSSSSMTHYTRDYADDALDVRSTEPLIGNRYEADGSARQHRVKLEMAGDFEITGINPALTMDGTE